MRFQYRTPLFVPPQCCLPVFVSIFPYILLPLFTLVFLRFLFYLYPSFFSPRLLHIVLYSYSLYFLYTEHTPTRFLPSKTFFPAFSQRLFLATFSFILFHKFRLFMFLSFIRLSFYRYCSSLRFFLMTFTHFFLRLCFFPSCFCSFFCHCLLSIPHHSSAWFPYGKCSNTQSYILPYRFFSLPVIARPCLQTQLTSQ